jgi:hypothetical protein
MLGSVLTIGDTCKKVHPVFHSSLFKLHKGPPPKRPMPIILAEDDDNQKRAGTTRYEIETIVKHRQTHRSRPKQNGQRTAKKIDGIQYLVKWKGYDIIHNTWEPATHLDKCPDILQEYWQKWGRENPNQTPLYPYD